MFKVHYRSSNSEGEPSCRHLDWYGHTSTHVFAVQDWKDTSRIFYPGSFSSLIDSIGEKHGRTASPSGNFHPPPPHTTSASSTLSATNRCNETLELTFLFDENANSSSRLVPSLFPHSLHLLSYPVSLSPSSLSSILIFSLLLFSISLNLNLFIIYFSNHFL